MERIDPLSARAIARDAGIELKEFAERYGVSIEDAAFATEGGSLHLERLGAEALDMMAAGVGCSNLTALIQILDLASFTEDEKRIIRSAGDLEDAGGRLPPQVGREPSAHPSQSTGDPHWSEKGRSDSA